MHKVSTAKFVDGRWTDSIAMEEDSDQTLTFVFGDSAQLDDSQPLIELRRRYPLATIVGASGAGIVSELDVLDGSLTATAVRFEHTSLGLAEIEVIHPETSREAGRLLATQLNSRPGLNSIFVLADGLNVNGPELVLGLNDVLPAQVGIAGGRAGDGVAFARTWTLVDRLPLQRIVTRSKGNVVYTLDGEPALALYKDFLGDLASQPAAGRRLTFPAQRLSKLQQR